MSFKCLLTVNGFLLRWRSCFAPAIPYSQNCLVFSMSLGHWSSWRGQSSYWFGPPPEEAGSIVCHTSYEPLWFDPPAERNHVVWWSTPEEAGTTISPLRPFSALRISHSCLKRSFLSDLKRGGCKLSYGNWFLGNQIKIESATLSFSSTCSVLVLVQNLLLTPGVLKSLMRRNEDKPGLLDIGQDKSF